ncbi:hypothetical protein DACRYDRAFT_21757, partial [Dacryopinax primogenitus]
MTLFHLLKRKTDTASPSVHSTDLPSPSATAYTHPTSPTTSARPPRSSIPLPNPTSGKRPPPPKLLDLPPPPVLYGETKRPGSPFRRAFAAAAIGVGGPGTQGTPRSGTG